MISSTVSRTHLWSGLVLAALGAYIVSQSLGWELLGASGPGPGFFPLIYGGLMVVLSLALVVQAALGRSGGWSVSAVVDREGTMTALALWGLFVAVIAVMPYVGFFLAFAALMFLIGRVVFSRPLAHCAAAAVGAPVLFYMVFTFGLQLRLPVGSLTGF